MSKLYDIVNETINAGSMLEAEQILFGSDGIVINSKEYYENIISNFVRKKETVIRKIVDSNGKTQLVFDLNNCNDMWNILFIYNYYISYLDNRITDLNQKINECKRVKDVLLDQKRVLNKEDLRYNEISKQWQDKETERKNLDKLKSYFIQLKNNSLRANAVQLENIERIDEIQLKQYLDKLKEAINCIQKIRDSLEHRNSNFNIANGVLNIDNKLGKFEISIPIEYLDGFNKGRIIANKEDHVIVERTNEMASPLLKALDYDIKKINSFFYNVEPVFLDMIMEKVDYDVNKLYQLSSYIFRYKKVTKIFIEKNLDICWISKLPEKVFYIINDTIQLNGEETDESKLTYIKEILQLKNAGIDIYKLPFMPSIVILCANEILQLKEEGIDIYKLPDTFFYKNETSELEKEIYLSKLSTENKLKEAGINISKLQKDAYFRANENEILQLKEEGIDIYKLPVDAFFYLNKILQLKEAGINISKLPFQIYKSPFIIILQVNKISQLKEVGIDIYKLSANALVHVDETLQLKEMGIDIYKLPSASFNHINETLQLKEAGIDIYKLPSKVFCNDLNLLNLKEIINRIGYDNLEILPIEFFICSTELLDEMFKKYNLNISKSIFGIKNPKIIAALVYANSVLSNYNDKTISTIDMDIKPYSIICDTYIDNYKYRNNIEENIGREYNSSEFVEQFKLFDDDSLDRSTDDIKKIILNKFRNACAHFRFKLVKDKDGNIIEDKVYIYDEDNNGINNFNLIIDLNEFVRIVREAEIYIGMQKNNVEELIRKSR